MWILIDSIVVTYHTPIDLIEFLASWDRYGEGRLWIMNVDAQSDSDKHIGRYANHPDITHVQIDHNCGYARAVNLGASFGNNPILAAFNADTILTPGLLEDCCHSLMKNQDWGVLGPHQVDKTGLTTHAGIFGTNTAPTHRAWHQKDSPEYHDVQEAVTVSGSAYFIKRNVWDELHSCPIYQEAHPEALGAFLPTPHYYEETWCSYHARAHGHKVMYYGEASMIHKWHTATPVGGWAEKQMPGSQKIFREMCALHSIPCD